VNDPGADPATLARCPVVDADRLMPFDLFAALPTEELERLAGVMSEVDVAAGAPIVTRGDFGYVLYAIEAGEAEVRVDGSDSARVIGSGDTFGEIALLVTGRRTASVVARTEMRLLSLFDQDFQRIRSQAPELERGLLRLGGERLSQ
jgi:CRP-like cAMP-binding protein